MKEKNKKGLFGFFQKIKNFPESSEETLPFSTPFTEIEENGTAESAASDSSDSAQGSADMDAAPISTFSVWEPSDDPLLVRIDEEALYNEYMEFAEKMNSLYEAFSRESSLSSNTEPQPKDAQPQLYISKDRMAAWLYVIPPLNGGQDINEIVLRATLAQERVTTGVLDEALKEIAEGPVYCRAVLVAKGILARNGLDGTIKDHYERIIKPDFKEDEKGTIDFRNLNMIQSVKEGETICEITPAVQGENGMTVTGQPYPYKVKGTEAKVPAGRNTILNKDRTLLTSQKTGHVTYINDRFQVDPVLKIDGNIDGNIGNLDYDGNILISGDVKSGFSVKASGSIDIRGSVESAKITAKGPITISNGVLGNGQGVLTSGSHIKCGYLEHCTVVAGGNVYANSIINSKVESDHDIVSTSGTGIM
ncbi:MAG: FapA family protein [Lacrimispora sp.]